MKKSILSYLTMAFALGLFFSSCIKDDAPGVGTAGTARIKILEAPQRSLFFSPFLTTKSIDLFSLRRDEISSAGIDAAVTAHVLAEPDSVDAYNTANGTTYEALPDSLYTLFGNGISRSGNQFSIPIVSKSIGTELTIIMDGSKWDVSHKYAMMYTISDSAGHRIPTGASSVFITIEAKNQWDGVYEVTGSFSDLTNSAFSAIYPYEWELQTLSPTQCVVIDNVNLGGAGFVFSTDGTGSAASLSYYGNFGLVVTFDPVTNKITAMENYYGQPAPNTRSALLDETSDTDNFYDLSTKTVNIKYYMTQPNVVKDPPNIRAKWNEKWKFVRERE